MGKKTNKSETLREVFGAPKTREEIIKAVTEPDSYVEKKTLVIHSSGSAQANFEKIAKKLNIAPGSREFKVLQMFCEEKKATVIETKAFTQRLKGLSDEQLKVIELLCTGKKFNTGNILKSIQSIKKFGSERLLMLRSFVDLKGAGAGPLNQFFIVTLPQGTRKSVGDEAWENDLKEKHMTIEQVNVFYNICHTVEGLTPKTAIAILPKVRQLKSQHSQVINTFLKSGSFFGTNPIGDGNIPGLINLWVSLPELKDFKRVPRLIKKLSRRPAKKKKDFQYLVYCFKEEVEKEEKKSVGNVFSNIRSLLS
jgi:hypothetical protein